MNKKSWLIAVASGVLVPFALWAANTQFSVSPSTIINCEAGGGCQITIAGGQASVASPEAPDAADGTFGGTTGLDSLRLKGDLTVDGASTLTGAVSIAGATTFSSSLAVTGAITNAAGTIVNAVSSTFSSSATSTVCAIQNTSGRTLTLLDANVIVPPTNSTGTVTFFAGTSTTPYASTTNALISASLDQGWIARVNPTSTLQTFTSPWGNNEYLVFKTTSTTNVGGGTCRASYY